MEKLKNIINPGSKKDDEVMYGSGNAGDPVQSGITGHHPGQGKKIFAVDFTYVANFHTGSHFGSSRTAGNDPLSSSTNPTSTSGTGTGYGDTSRNEPLSTSTNPTGGSQYDTPSTGQGSHGLNEPYASRMPGGFDDDAATTASVRSGVPGQSLSGPGIMGTNDSSLNKPLPREPASASTSAAAGSSLTGNSYPDRSIGSSGYGDQSTGSSHLGRDAVLGTGAIGAGTAAHHRHEEPQRDNYAPETGRSFPLGGNSSPQSGSNYGPGQTGTYPAGGAGSTTAGPHSSNLANKADPRVDSDLDGPRTAGNTGYGSTGTGYGSGTGATPSSANQGSLGRDATLGPGAGAGAGAVGSGMTSGGVGYGPESWEHKHGRHGHQYEDDPCETGTAGSAGAHPLHTSGPHITDTANRLDPHVSGDATGGLEHTTDHGNHGHHGHRGQEAALAGGAGGAGLGAYEGSGGTTGSSTGAGLDPSTMGTTGSSSTGKTAGPHKSSILNKLDPRVDSDMSKQHAAGTGSAMGTTGTSDPYPSTGSSGRDHHLGRDAGLIGAGGAAAYEAEKHHHGQGRIGTNSGIGSSDPYSSSGIDSSRDTTETGRDHHVGRDAALGAGAGGLAYEAEHHHGKPTQPSTIPSDTTGSAYGNTRGQIGSSYDQAGTQLAGSGHQPATAGHHHTTGTQAAAVGTDTERPHKSHGLFGHHKDKDAAVAGGALGAGGAGYEAEKLRNTGRVDPGTQIREHEHPGASAATYPSPDYGHERVAGTSHGHHKVRDGALGGAPVGGAGYEAEKLHDPVSSHGATQGPQGLGRTAEPIRDHHTGRDAALVGGGASAGALAGHEYSEKDAKHLQKEHAKEEKALEKEHSKEIKHHDNEIAKEHKHHDKEVAKHENAIEKDEKHHDHGGEKKHGGLLGLFHREKPDPALKEDEARHQAQASGKVAHRGDYPEEMSAGTGATSQGLERPYGTESGAHDAPVGFGNATSGGLEGTSGGLEKEYAGTGARDTGIGSGMTTHDAYDNDPNMHNKLHKDPPAKVLDSRGL